MAGTISENWRDMNARVLTMILVTIAPRIPEQGDNNHRLQKPLHCLNYKETLSRTVRINVTI